MSRSKKSRKPGRIKPSTAPKPLAVEDKEPRARKKTGNKSGTRQQEARVLTNQDDSLQAKDPRIGSKKKIDLGIVITPKKSTKTRPDDHRPSVAPIQVVEKSEPDTVTLEKELLAIESDQEVQMIAIRVNSGEEVNEQDAEKLASNLERYQELITLLGLDSQDEEDEESNVNKDEAEDSEDALWDKFDDADFSDFKE